MIFPGDIYLNKHKYIINTNEGIIPRYDTAFIDDRELRLVIKSFEGCMAKENFKMQDVEEVIKNTDWREHKRRTGIDFKTEPFKAIWGVARPDIKLDLDFWLERYGPEKKWMFVLNATDMYTNTPIGKGVNGAGAPCLTCNPLDILTEENYNRVREFADEIIQYYNDLEQNGREVILTFQVEQSSGLNLNSQFDNERLGRILEDLANKYAFPTKMADRAGNETETELSLKIRIPLTDEKGRRIDAAEFLRKIQQDLKSSPYFLDMKIIPNGLGKATLSIESTLRGTNPNESSKPKVDKLVWISPNPDTDCTNNICTTDKTTFVFKVHYEANVKLDPSDFKIYLNNQLYQNAKSENVGIDGKPLYFKINGNTFSGSVQLEEQENELYIEVLGKQTQKIKVYLDKGGPKLYIITVGVQNEMGSLLYPNSDADSIRQIIKTQYGMGLYETIDDSFSIFAKNVSKTMILEKLDALKNLNIKQNDLVFIFLSGHGDIDNDRFFFHCFDYKNGYKTITTVSDQEIASRLDEIHCKKVIMIDACREKTNVSQSKEKTEYLRKSLNADVFLMSCSDGELSWEATKLKMATFTYTFLQGLKGDADYDKNGEITWGEIGKYLIENTPKVNEQQGLKAQNPQIFFDNFPTPQTWQQEVFFKLKK